MLSQLSPQLFDLFRRGDSILRHAVQNGIQLAAGSLAPSDEQRAFFLLILFDVFWRKVILNQFHQRIILFEELRQIQILSAFEALLVEVDRPDSELDFLEIGRDIKYIIVGTHVAKETNKAAVIKLYQLFGNAHPVETFVIEIGEDELVAGNACDMFFYQRILVSEIIDPGWGKDVLQLQSINPGGVFPFVVE